MDTDTLYASIQELIQKGEEAPLRAFIAEHINDFPEDIRNQIAMFFFEEVTANEAAGITAEEQFQTDALEALEHLGSLKRFLEEKLQLTKVQNRLNINTDTNPEARS